MVDFVAEKAPDFRAKLAGIATAIFVHVARFGRAFLARLFEKPAPTLQPYRRQPALLPHKIKKTLIVTIIAIMGMMYGFMTSIFPTSFYVFMATPIVFMSILVIWLLPEADTVFDRQVEWLFFAFFISLLVWPNYLAVDPPGLPWITMIRLWSVPMVLFFLISISMSPHFRGRIVESFKTSPWARRLMLLFVVTQLVTLPFSKALADSFNKLINVQIEWTAIFFIASFVFIIPGRAMRWAKLLIAIVIFWCGMAVWEYQLGRVPWADHIPSFLAIQDERVQAILAGGQRAAIGEHRLQGPFSTPLNFAEFMGLSVAFFLYFITITRKFLVRAALVACLPVIFWVIRGTDSRLGVVAFLVSFLVYLLLWSLQRKLQRSRDLLSETVLLAYPAVLGVVFVLSLFWQRLNHMIWGGGQHAASNAGRKEQYADGIAEILKWPIGNGIGQGAETLGSRNAVGVLTIDSYYLVIGLEYGIIGFLAYYGLMLTGTIKAATAAVKTNDSELGLLLPLSVSMTAFVVVKGVLAQDDIHAMIFMMLGMIMALLHRAKNEPVAKAVQP